MNKEKLTAEELLEWALENIHSSNWRLLMITKTYEEEIKKLSEEQIKGIKLFLKLIHKNKWYYGSSSVVRIGEIDEMFKELKKINKS